jgi:hypothetical protein
MWTWNCRRLNPELKVDIIRPRVFNVYMSTTQTTTTVRVVTKCAGCKTAQAEDIASRELQDFHYQTSIRGGGVTPYRSCRVCGRGLHRWNMVNGTVRGAVKCTSRCTSATGSDCECECGGDNHGADNL